MKLNKSGFAVTGIIYSMLVLFLALVLLIMSNLASRKVLFDKEKGEILEKINGSFLCVAIAPTEQLLWNNTSNVMESKVVGVQATSEEPYQSGAVYSCNLGDGPRTFYVLEDEGENVKLLMNENLEGKVTWCDQNGPNPYDTACAADGAKAHMIRQTSNWTKLMIAGGTVELPDAQDLVELNTPDWARINMDVSIFGYWTSTVAFSNRAQFMNYSTYLNSRSIDESHGGVRPVIKLLKSYFSL